MEPGDFSLVAELAEDYGGLYDIPTTFGKYPADKSPEMRKQLEIQISKTYERLYRAGLIDVYLLDTESNEAEKFDPETALLELQNLKNYDYTTVSTRYVAVLASDKGLKWLESC